MTDDLATRDEILEHYKLSMSSIFESEMVHSLLGHTGERIATEALGPCVLCRAVAQDSAPVLLVAAGIIDATVNALPWNDPATLDIAVDVQARVIAPGGIPSVRVNDDTRFVVVGGGKSACDTTLHLRRLLATPIDSDEPRIVWIVSTPLAFLQRDKYADDETFSADIHRLLGEHEANPDVPLFELKTYTALFHHFTHSGPHTTHHGVMGYHEVAQLSCQSRVEGARVVSVKEDHIELSTGQQIVRWVGFEPTRPQTYEPEPPSHSAPR